MSFRWILTLALTLTFAQSCSSHSNESAPLVSEQRFKTKPGCVRSENAETFDARCDVPLLGYSGFSGL